MISKTIVILILLWAVLSFSYYFVIHHDWQSLWAGIGYVDENNKRVSQNASLVFHSSQSSSQSKITLIAEASPPANGSDQPSCQHEFKPKCKLYPYIQYWKQHFTDKDCYRSPLYREGRETLPPYEERKYLLFQPDAGGWNNIRMAAEMAIIFAHASGRILVMPPVTKMYLLDRNRNELSNYMGFETFFDMEKLSESLDIISMEKFLQDVAERNLMDRPHNQVPYPPLLKGSKFYQKPRSFFAHAGGLWKYLNQAAFVRHWEPGKFHIGFNLTKSKGHNGIFGTFSQNRRRRAHSSHGRTLLPYDAEMHSHRTIFFPGDYRHKFRTLTHFYTYLFFADIKVDKFYKRLARDRIRYHDALFCAAGRVVALLHRDAAALSVKRKQTLQEMWGEGGGHVSMQMDSRDKMPSDLKEKTTTVGGNTNTGSTYFAFHIRRGDFQYTNAKTSPKEIYDTTKRMLNPNISQLIYIATDEKDASAFDSFRTETLENGMPKFQLRFLHDYVEEARLLPGQVNQNFLGMIEQIVCANAHSFFGTPLSTFTGYITRLRGYYRDDRYERTFYTIARHMYSLQKRKEIKGPFWAREFAVAHINIDDDSAMNGYNGGSREKGHFRGHAVNRAHHYHSQKHKGLDEDIHTLINGSGKKSKMKMARQPQLPHKKF